MLARLRGARQQRNRPIRGLAARDRALIGLPSGLSARADHGNRTVRALFEAHGITGG